MELRKNVERRGVALKNRNVGGRWPIAHDLNEGRLWGIICTVGFLEPTDSIPSLCWLRRNQLIPSHHARLRGMKYDDIRNQHWVPF